MKVVNEILFKKQSKKQLIVAVLGSLIGLVFMFMSIHFLIGINSFGEESDVLGPNTLIIQKKVSNASSFNLTSNVFGEEELISYEKLSFIEDLNVIVSNNFPVSIETNDPIVPYFRSDIFVQTVNKEFIDLQESAVWSWNENDSIVPIVLPREFLLMLNTFMSSSGIPQISDDIAKSISFELVLSKNTGAQKFKAKIIGFTNEVSSILVPETFMEYGNKKFSVNKNPNITQLMLKGKEGKFGLIEDFLKENHLESNQNHLISGRLKSIISMLLTSFLILSMVTVFISGLLMIQYVQLIIGYSSDYIKSLLKIGYSIPQISKSLFIFFITLMSLVCLSALGLFLFFKEGIESQLIISGIKFDFSISPFVFVAGLFVFLCFSVFGFITTIRAVSREF
jgi:hypothetical protein